MASTDHLQRRLYDLAEIGWAKRRHVPDMNFVLRSSALPRPTSSSTIEAVIDRLYSHARLWAPGFEVPFRVPRVLISPIMKMPGQYRVDQYGYVSIHVASEYMGRDSQILTILAHEACHHILDLSGVRGSSTRENEVLTDLAAFVCGFGQLILDGHRSVVKSGSAWSAAHIGYLDSAEYAFAQRWVLRVQGLDTAAPRSAERTPTQRLRDLVARILGLGPRDEGYRAPAFGNPRERALADLRKRALARLSGDRSKLERLIEYERRRRPSGDELYLLETVMESLERDRR